MKIAVALVALLVVAAGIRAESERAPEPRPDLASIRAELESARFEAVVAATTALLAQPDLAERDILEALVLRSQARVSQGLLAKAEEDWQRLLVLDPYYSPDPLTTGRKPLDRFDKVQQSIVGTVRVVVDPPGAEVSFEGKPVRLPVDGIVRLAAGSRRLTIANPGFDPVEMEIAVVAGELVPLEVRLVPNARPAIVTTDRDGVEVWLEGRLLGRTQRGGPEGSAITGPARLVLDPLPLGDHVLELRQECHRTTTVDVLVSVDLLDRSPIRIPPVSLPPARSLVTFSGGTPGAEVSLGGERVAKLPVDAPVSLCAGARLLEVRASGRAVWRGIVEVPDDDEISLDVSPRPNAAIFGADRWPDDLAALAASFGTTAGLPLPDAADLTRAAGWSGVTLPPDTDVAVAVVPAAGTVPGLAKVYLYSPWLGTVVPVTGPPSKAAREPWRRLSYGWHLADFARSAGVVVVETIPEGPAVAAGVSPGDRLIAIDGRAVTGAAEARLVLESATKGGGVTLTVAARADGTIREAKIAPVVSPFVREPAPALAVERAIVAAYAAVDGAGSPDAPSALATLGAMLIREGRAERAVDLLRRARFGSRAGVGDGTIAYFLGRALVDSGREAEARDAFRAARQSSSTAFADEGLEIAPAAADYLADLGVTAR